MSLERNIEFFSSSLLVTADNERSSVARTIRDSMESPASFEPRRDIDDAASIYAPSEATLSTSRRMSFETASTSYHRIEHALCWFSRLVYMAFPLNY